MSISLVGRDTTPSKLSAVPPMTTASNRRPRSRRNRSNASMVSSPRPVGAFRGETPGHRRRWRRARLRSRALCSAGCTEDRSMQIRWEHSTEEFNQQLQDLTQGVPGIRDHSGIQPTKKSGNGYFTSKTAPGRTGITESQERDAPGREISENLEHRKSRQRRRRQWSWPAR
jgi:hypothetical protein